MDGALFPPATAAKTTLLQNVLVGRDLDRQVLYWRDGASGSGRSTSVQAGADGSLQVSAGGVVGFDTYFNAFFESQWRRHTSVKTVALQIRIEGAATVRVFRDALNTRTLLVEQAIGSAPASIEIASQAINFRQHGILTFELQAGQEPFTLHDAAWVTPDPPVADIGLAAVICTFDRETDVARVVGSLGNAPHAVRALKRVFVVNQGRPGLEHSPAFAMEAAPLGNRLCVIEQANFGGAGGFSRGLLAALADPLVTHVMLLDDDVAIEPDSLVRMAAFYAFCDRDVLLGGHMLDLLHPTYLYEAGAVITEHEWEFRPQHFGRDIAPAAQLPALAHPYPVHYNGWWCCGVPLAVVREHGMPLPCFIRGDDLEFGMRLHQRGVPTVPMPGVAVWHEPFYLKLGNWQLYYETRNMLAAMALHTAFDRSEVTRRMGLQIVKHLLTYRYYSTALILRGIEDFLAGPTTMRQPPLARHASLMTLKAQFAPGSLPREVVAATEPLAPMSTWRLSRIVLTLWLLLRNAVLPTCTTGPRTVPVEDLHWLTIRRTGHVAAETWWDDALPTYRRTRGHHTRLAGRTARLLVRLWLETPRAAAAWRDAAPQLTSVPFWTEYLAVPTSQPRDGAVPARMSETRSNEYSRSA